MSLQENAKYPEQYNRQQLQCTECHIYFIFEIAEFCYLVHISFKFSFFFLHFNSVRSLLLLLCVAQWDCVKKSATENVGNWTYFMHILLQLTSSKAAVFFISDENSGWLPISLLLIISFSFDRDYECSVRRTHLFISFAWWDGLFWSLHRLLHIKNGFRSKLGSCECAHMALAFPLYVCTSSCISGFLLCETQTMWVSCILSFLISGCYCFKKNKKNKIKAHVVF